MADIKLNFVNSYRDPRNGKMRHQFRRKGCRKIMLKGRPGSAEFMDHYAELLAQSENAAAHVGASKIKPGSIDALIVKYLQHDTFTKGLAKATQAARRPILDNFPPVHDAGWSPLWREPPSHHPAQEHHRRARRQDADHAEGLDEGAPTPDRVRHRSGRVARPIRPSGSRRPDRPRAAVTSRGATPRSNSTASSTRTARWRGSHWN